MRFSLRQYVAATSLFTSAFSCESPKLGSGLPLTKKLGVLRTPRVCASATSWRIISRILGSFMSMRILSMFNPAEERKLEILSGCG